MDISVVLPTYKEKENLAILIPQIEDGFRDTEHEIIIVDDGSEDGTREIIAEFQRIYQNILFVERPGLMGIGSALREGYNRARGTFLISSDADCSFSVADMRALYTEILGGLDVVLGYRVASIPPSGSNSGARSFQGWLENYVISPLSNRVIGVFSGMKYRNYNTNFRAIRLATWRGMQTFEDRQFFHFEVLLNAKAAGAKISEIAVAFSPRFAGVSKVSFLSQAPGYLYKLIKMACSKD